MPSAQCRSRLPWIGLPLVSGDTALESTASPEIDQDAKKLDALDGLVHLKDSQATAD